MLKVRSIDIQAGRVCILDDLCVPLRTLGQDRLCSWQQLAKPNPLVVQLRNPVVLRAGQTFLEVWGLQGYLAHKKQPPSPGSP